MQIAAFNLYPEDLTAVEIDTGDGRPPWAFLPFEDQRAELFPLSGSLILAVGNDRRYAVFDGDARRKRVEIVVAQRHSKSWTWSETRRVLYVADSDGVVSQHTGQKRMNGVREVSLDGIDRFHPFTPEFHVSGLFIRDDGCVLSENLKEIGVLDPASGAVTISEVEGFVFSLEHMRLVGLKWFSPDGRWGLKAHLGSVVRREGVKAGWPWRRAPALEHPDLKADGLRRYGWALDLCTLDPVKVERRLVMRYRTAEELFSNRYGDASANQARIDALADQRDYRAWNGRDRLLILNAPSEDNAAYEAGKPLDALVANVLLRPIRDVEWDADSRGFTVVVGLEQRHVSLTGEVGPLSPSTWAEPAWRSDPLPSEKALKTLRKHIRERTVQRLALLDLSAASLRDGVRAMADRLGAGLENILFRDVLQFRFKVGGKTIGEKAFFDAIRALPEAEAQPLLADLRRLIASFGEQARGHVLTAGESINAGGPSETQHVALADAALALAELDPVSFEVLRGWFEQVDQEHDMFAVENVFPAIARKTGFTTPDAVRFGLWFFLHQWQTTPYDFADFPILAGARALWTPAEFARVALDEACRVVEDRGPGYIRQDFNSCFGSIEHLLDAKIEWDRLALAEADKIFPNKNDA